MKNYPKVKWVNIYPKNIVASLPIIAKYTKGRLFERGIFVQYFLAKELNKRNIKHIILADGADQILDRFRLTIIGKSIIRLKDYFVSSRFGIYYQRFYKIPIKANGDIFKNKLFKYKNDPELDTIIYKGLLTFNYFGIVPHYSFINNEIIVFCKNLSFLNFRKMYYRFFVKKYLGKNTSSYMNKIPGAFDIENFIKMEYLILLKNNKFFLNYVSKDKILKFCKNRKKYYNQIYQLLYLYYS